MIVAGSPNWSRIGQREGQALLDLIGEEAVWRECQNVTAPAAEKLVWTGFSESLHVIDWQEFAAVFGSDRIPAHWHLFAGYDAGTTAPTGIRRCSAWRLWLLRIRRCRATSSYSTNTWLKLARLKTIWPER